MSYRTDDIAPARIHLWKPPISSNELCNFGSEKIKGHWGFEKDTNITVNYQNQALTEIRELLQDNSIVILPEFSGTPALTKDISDVVSSFKKPSYVIAGSYYAMRQGKVASICPIVLSDGSIYEQYKFFPSDDEQGHGCDVHDQEVMYVFKNTGVGNFAVQICSDALRERINPLSPIIRKHVDLLIVPAHNRSRELPNQLRSLSFTERRVVAYCNWSSDDSVIHTPLRDDLHAASPRTYIIDIADLYHRSKTNGRGIQRTEGFKPRPGYWASFSSIMFRRDLRVLAIGSHFDDIWLGCSATLMLLRESYDAEIVCTDLCDIYAEPYFGRFVVDVERTRTEIRDLCKKLFFEEYFVERGNLGALADRDFPKQLDRLSDRIRFLHQRYHDADLVLIPRRDDYHEDHALATKEILKEFRGPMFLEYEIKEFRREPFRPSLFVDVTAKAHRGISLSEGKLKSRSVSIAEKKARIIEDLFTRIFEVPITELPNAFSRENVLGRMALRAEEAGLDSMFAEAFATDLVVK